MRKRLTQSLRRLALDTGGAEVAEAAAVLPLLFMVLIGIFWFGQAFRIYGTITRAAQDGARAAVAPACSTCAALASTPGANALSAISNVLTTARLDPSKVTPPTTTPTLLSCTDGSAVSCDATPSSVCVQENIRLSDPATGATGSCGVSVSFQYPYQFWLPFASLNQQKIQIPAAARVRQETQ
jgi:Flp pilus assembly protein TadG